MSIALQLTRTCTILNIDTGGDPDLDDDGQVLPRADVTIEGVICRYGELSRTEIVQLEIAGLDNIAGYVLIPAGVTVYPRRSRVTAITRRDGGIEQAGPLTVERVTTRRMALATYQYCLLSRDVPADRVV